MTIKEIAETITADFSEYGLAFNKDKWYTDPWDVLVRCSSFVIELNKYIWLNPAFQPLNNEYMIH